ncbi:hypothetical protein SB757_30850, partial [Pseudomonas sp. SIMBA_065]
MIENRPWLTIFSHTMLILGIAVILACALGRMSSSVDGLIYDRLLMLRSLPLSPDIVVVDIDNQSVSAL